MNILVPVNDCDLDDAMICSIDDVKYWLLFDISEGKLTNSQFFQNKQEISDLIDLLIVKDQKEEIWTFLEEGISILVTTTQRYINEIVEGYLFKELHQFNK